MLEPEPFPTPVKLDRTHVWSGEIWMRVGYDKDPAEAKRHVMRELEDEAYARGYNATMVSATVEYDERRREVRVHAEGYGWEQPCARSTPTTPG